MQRILPSLKIHTWGGLGSQLFAVALASDLRDRFPERKILLVLHTGGVTHRNPEVRTLFPEYDYQFIDDYLPRLDGESNFHSQIHSNMRIKVRVLIKRLARISGLTTSGDDDLEFSYLKPWVMSCRGHYSYRTISSNFLLKLNMRLHENSSNMQLSQSCTVHYRLGDLLTLAEKSPIPSDIIISTVKKSLISNNFRDLVVFSDSPEKVSELFGVNVPLDVISPNSDTVEVMANSIDSKLFIGTSSKISFWIAGIRAQVKNSSSVLPSINSRQFSGLVGEKKKLISTYQVNS